MSNNISHQKESGTLPQNRRNSEIPTYEHQTENLTDPLDPTLSIEDEVGVQAGDELPESDFENKYNMQALFRHAHTKTQEYYSVSY